MKYPKLDHFMMPRKYSNAEGNSLLKNWLFQFGSNRSINRNKAKPSSCDHAGVRCNIQGRASFSFRPGGRFFSMIRYCPHIAEPSRERKISSNLSYPRLSPEKNSPFRYSTILKACLMCAMQESLFSANAAFQK